MKFTKTFRTAIIIAAATALTGICSAQTTTANGDTSATETKLKAMEDSWAASQLQTDRGASTVDGMLASDYTGVSSKGEIRNKAEHIEHMKSDTDTYTESKNDSMKVHVFAPNLATLAGS